MSTVWVHAAAGCAAIAGWLYKALSRHDSRLPGEEPAVAHDCGSSWTILILRMLQVSLRQGSSIPRALDMVGKAVGGDAFQAVRGEQGAHAAAELPLLRAQRLEAGGSGGLGKRPGPPCTTTPPSGKPR